MWKPVYYYLEEIKVQRPHKYLKRSKLPVLKVKASIQVKIKTHNGKKKKQKRNKKTHLTTGVGVGVGFPGGPVVRALHVHCRGHGFDPWLGN